ncbi:hypothetical protein CISG_09214 [Coccidioides immitis RMSCC 3703]|uniref:Protein kinase domain-containing protein n=1 Tax=Coccidioides immitis RMSCC 3703 TaxID=454286 RepID=A0A0J8R9R2_COCIT|nr:hypothetical protein CISG_09214 [Coccidioides immitis RMSCC 3703]
MNLSTATKMERQSDKHLTVIDFEALKSSHPSDGICMSQGDLELERQRKVQLQYMKKPAGKVITGPPKTLALPQIVESGGSSSLSLITRSESPWDTFCPIFKCQLASTVILSVHHTQPSRVVAIWEYPMEMMDKVVQRSCHICHENILSTRECYVDGDLLYAVVNDLPLTLENLVASSAYPNEQELASIISQVLKGLSSLATVGLELESLTCSNILIGLDGVVKIAGLESCMELTRGQLQSQSIRALANIMMELMQKYDKDGGLVGVDDLERWPLNSDAVEFLVAVRASSRCRKKRSRLPTSWFHQVIGTAFSNFGGGSQGFVLKKA